MARCVRGPRKRRRLFRRGRRARRDSAGAVRKRHEGGPALSTHQLRADPRRRLAGSTWYPCGTCVQHRATCPRGRQSARLSVWYNRWSIDPSPNFLLSGVPCQKIPRRECVPVPSPPGRSRDCIPGSTCNGAARRWRAWKGRAGRALMTAARQLQRGTAVERGSVLPLRVTIAEHIAKAPWILNRRR